MAVIRHTLTLFADENGNAVRGAGGTVCLQDHDPTALGNPLCIMGEKVDAIYEAGAKFLRAVGYHGFANFDINYDARRDGSYRFFRGEYPLRPQYLLHEPCRLQPSRCL